MNKLNFLFLLFIFIACNKDKDSDVVSANSEDTTFNIENLSFKVSSDDDVQNDKFVLYLDQKEYNLVGKIVKHQNIKNSRFLYRTNVVSEDGSLDDGLESTGNNYEDFTLPDDNQFSLKGKIAKEGKYKFTIQFKDETNKEFFSKSFLVEVKDRPFYVEEDYSDTETDLSNIFVDDLFSVRFLIKNVKSSENYKIRFTNFTVNGKSIDNPNIVDESLGLKVGYFKLQLFEDLVLKKEYNFTNNVNDNFLSLKFSSHGDFSLSYEIYKDSDFKFKKTLFFKIKKYDNPYLVYDKSNLKYFNIDVKVSEKTEKEFIRLKAFSEEFKREVLVEGGYSVVFEYRTWVFNSKGERTNDISSTNDDLNAMNKWFSTASYVYDSSGFDFPLKAVFKKEGSYNYYFQISDTKNNLSKIYVFKINVTK